MYRTKQNYTDTCCHISTAAENVIEICRGSGHVKGRCPAGWRWKTKDTKRGSNLTAEIADEFLAQ